ncbi:MAG TPA: RHS repeat-associated core domain-containing protein [Gemmata sp.]
MSTDGTAQARTANAQNEITSIAGATTPTYDANGNMTGDETGRQFVYDAWNRLVAVKNSGGITLKTYEYDGLNRRVSETATSVTTDLFYSDLWQVLEEQVAGDTTTRYVWSPVYVDAMILRDRDTDANGTLDERLWVQQDANWNVTALVDGSGSVVERYVYDAFGVRTVYDASYAVRGGGSAYEFAQGFQGVAFDPTPGLNFTDTRPYSPSLGRFTGPDWIRFGGGDVNLYRFVGNNPANATDPSGLIDYRLGTDDPRIGQDPGAGVWGSVGGVLADLKTTAMKEAIYTALPIFEHLIGPNAVRHMNHFLGNSGSPLTIPLAQMVNEVPSAKRLYCSVEILARCSEEHEVVG